MVTILQRRPPEHLGLRTTDDRVHHPPSHSSLTRRAGARQGTESNVERPEPGALLGSDQHVATRRSCGLRSIHYPTDAAMRPDEGPRDQRSPAAANRRAPRSLVDPLKRVLQDEPGDGLAERLTRLCRGAEVDARENA